MQPQAVGRYANQGAVNHDFTRGVQAQHAAHQSLSPNMRIVMLTITCEPESAIHMPCLAKMMVYAMNSPPKLGCLLYCRGSCRSLAMWNSHERGAAW
jgi:hypothetical protein